MQRERKLRALRQVLTDEQLLKGDEAVFYCPKCQHRKPKLSVNLVTDNFNCWVCGFAGKTLVPILRLKGETPDLQEYRKELDERWGKGPTEPEKKYDIPILPEEFRSLSTPSRSPYQHQAMEYLAQRGVTADDILRMKLGYCEDGEYKGRVIFPSFDEYGELNFFTGRAIYKGPLSYKHGNFCKDIIFNEYLVDWTEPVVLTEGPFDALKAGENAIPLQGCRLNADSKLFRKVVTSGADTYFAMDTDAFRKQLDIIRLFLAYGVNCFYVSLHGRKDVGEMSNAEFLLAKEKATPVRSDVDLLKLRITG